MNNVKLLIVIIVLIPIVFIYFYKTNQRSEFLKSISTSSYNMLANDNFDLQALLSSGYPVLINIGSEDCIACKEMYQPLKNAATQLNDKGYVIFIDYTRSPKAAKQFKFSLTPTQFFYDADGKLYKTHIGVLSEYEIMDIFEEIIAHE